MRRSIYKRELFEIKQKINNSAIYEVFENTVFNDTHKDRGNKLLFVKEDIFSIDKLKSILEGIQEINEEIMSEIENIFTIDDDLSIPPDLKEAIKNEQVVLFIGAGVSQSLGYPSWQDLANKAIDLLKKENKINDFERDRLKQIVDPKEVLTIFEKICPRNRECGGNFYRQIFEKRDEKYKDEKNIYDLLTKPEFAWKFLTTNIDLEIIKSLAEHDYKLSQEEQEQELRQDVNEADKTKTSLEKFNDNYRQNAYVIGLVPDKNKDVDNSDVIFLHGIADNAENTIFTTKDYLKTYFNSDPKKTSTVKKVLYKVFGEKTVLFIGYGLSEFAILESIIHFDEERNNWEENKKHYSLYSTYHSDVHTLNIKQKAFEELNIELIPYYIDFNGFDRLYNVIENWHKIIKVEKGEDFFDERNLLNDIL